MKCRIIECALLFAVEYFTCDRQPTQLNI